MNRDWFAELDDMRKIDEAHKAWLSGVYDGVEMGCWNEAEAKRYEKYAKEKYPDMPIRFSWFLTQ